jgi:hypothetical protein
VNRVRAGIIFGSERNNLVEIRLKKLFIYIYIYIYIWAMAFRL